MMPSTPKHHFQAQATPEDKREASEREGARKDEADEVLVPSLYDITRLSPLNCPRSNNKAIHQCYQQQQPKEELDRKPPPKDEQRPLCRFFVLQGNCRYGADCINSHVLPEGASLSEARKEIPCPFFLRGNCKYGDFCHLRHDEHDLPPSRKIMAARIAASATASEQETDHHQGLLCGICLENPANKGDKNFGLLSSCSHVFCYECLMEWRKQGTLMAEDRRNCPTCRIHSDYVVPSNIFAVGEQKELIIAEYKERLGRINCKRFNGTLGSCPFGRDCFFAHKSPISGQDIKSSDQSMKELCAQRRRRASRQRHNRDEIEMMNELLLLLDLFAISRGILRRNENDDEDDDDSEW